MAVDSKFYVHDADRAALKTLQAIPGFNQLIRGFMKVWSERQLRIINMSSNIRINERQMSKYYDMLPPICQKLGIDIPELYLQMDVRPNSYTSGDTKPFIVLTSGLFEKIPDELIPTVLAHECGHIACHHVLYSTMGRLLMGTARTALTSFVPFGGVISTALEVAFYYWMRCSEYSADRAAVLCDGTAEKMSEVCMRLAGFDKDIDAIENKAEFMAQAREYRDMINNSKWDKTLEFMMLRTMDHPLMTIRALECEEWGQSSQFKALVVGTYQDAWAGPAAQPAPGGAAKKPMFDLNSFVSPLVNFVRDGVQGKPGDKAPDDMPADEPVDVPADGPADTPADIPPEAPKADDLAAAADRLRAYKLLLDEGIITQEEYDKVKKELLGL